MAENDRRARQLACLEHMGIDVWVRRGADTPPTMAAAAPAHAAATTPAAGHDLCAGDDEARSVDWTASGDIAGAGWEDLRARVRDCRRCPLHETRTQGVFGVGSEHASLMIVGEAPGGEEDRRGEPFVGRAGKLLDEMLKAIGLDRGSVYITNILKSRPPNNRDPRPEEVAACEPYLRRQIELISPILIVAVGRVAAQNLLGTDRPLGRLRGSWHQYGPQQTPLLATYHPAYLLRNPADKRKSWEDLKRVRARLAAQGTDGQS